jgi:hypothetical protein
MMVDGGAPDAMLRKQMMSACNSLVGVKFMGKTYDSSDSALYRNHHGGYPHALAASNRPFVKF